MIDLLIITILLILILIYGSFVLFYNVGFPCIFKKITGLYCPGCGISRMFISIYHLDFYQAFRYNPLIFILLIMFIIYMFAYIINKIVFKKKMHINKKYYYFLLILIVIYWIARNIPLFSFLAPTIVK